MNRQEKRALAVQRELSELRAVADSFGKLVHDAHLLNDELRASFARLDSLWKEDELARKIDEADYQAKRGKYAYLRPAAETYYVPTGYGEAYSIEGDIYKQLTDAGYEDESWRNDVCPKFAKPLTHHGRPDGRQMIIWVDAKNESDREVPDDFRFCVQVSYECETVAVICSTDSIDDALREAEEWIERADRCRHPMTVEGVCYRCKARVGKQSG